MLLGKETRKSSEKKGGEIFHACQKIFKNFPRQSQLLVKKREELSSVVSFGRQFFEHPPPN